MGFAVVADDWLFRQSWVGSSQAFATVSPMHLGSRFGEPTSPLAIYEVALVLLVLGAGAAAALGRWGPRRTAVAVRDNDAAASSFGVNPPTVKVAILAVSGFFAAAPGVVWAYAWRVVSSGPPASGSRRYHWAPPCESRIHCKQACRDSSRR